MCLNMNVEGENMAWRSVWLDKNEEEVRKRRAGVKRSFR